MFCPRPILKRTPSAHPAQASVHFPSSPLLTRTFDAPSYDRTPIVVTPNSCALPERGGRCYMLSETKFPPRNCPELIPDSESDESDDSSHHPVPSLLFANAHQQIPHLPDYAFSQPPETPATTKKQKPVFCDDLPFPPTPTKKKKRLALCKALSRRDEQEPTGGCLDGF